MSEREQELKRALIAIQRRYAAEIEPITKELVSIEMRKRPKPQILPDGMIYTYVGPWPYDDDGNPISSATAPTT